MKFLITLAFLFGSLIAHAHNHDKGGKPHMDPACEPLKAACDAAGYKLGGHKAKEGKGEGGKGLVVDCMVKWAKGESVAGLSIKADDPKFAACKSTIMSYKAGKKAARRAARRAQKEGKGGGDTVPVEPPAESE